MGRRLSKEGSRPAFFKFPTAHKITQKHITLEMLDMNLTNVVYTSMMK